MTSGRKPALLLNFDPATWYAALHQADPTLELRLPEALGDPADIDCLLTHKVVPGLIGRLPNLKLLYAVGAGVDYLIDEMRAHPRLRVVRIVDEAVSGDVATLAVAGALQWMRDLQPYARQQADQVWAPLPPRSSTGTTVGILGMGRIGSAAARAFAALGFTVCGWSRQVLQHGEGIEAFAGPEGLQSMLPRTNILVCTLPLTPQTEGLINADLLARLPRGACVVNVGRGAHVDETALLAALDSGQLAGAFLDVTDVEPLPQGHRLWTHPAVRVTPHVASRTQPLRITPQVVENLRRLRAGETLLNEVDVGAGY